MKAVVRRLATNPQLNAEPTSDQDHDELEESPPSNDASVEFSVDNDSMTSEIPGCASISCDKCD